MEENWKDITGFEGRYKVSDKGRVWSLITNRVLKHGLGTNGYHAVSLRKDGHTYQFSVHRLVAKEFVDNPHSKPEINHINSVRDDNRKENLEWVTRKENVHHSIIHGNTLVGENRKDNSSGVTGVHEHKNGWIARIGFKHERHYLGLFDSFEEAKKIRKKAEISIKEGSFINGEHFTSQQTTANS